MEALKPAQLPAAAGPSGRQELRTWLELVLQSGAVARAWRQQLATLIAEYELTDQEFVVLWLCDDQPLARRGQSGLAEAVGASPAQMSGLVERLRRRDLLQFERLEHDRRRQVWQLTDSGRLLLRQLCDTLLTSKQPLGGELSLIEEQQLLRLLQQWSPLESNSAPQLKTPGQGGRSSCAA